MDSNKIISVMESIPILYKGKGVVVDKIRDAETQLGVTFAEDFRTFLHHYGYALANGHEILGLGESPDLVEVTLIERLRGHDVESEWYVLEVAGIDGIVIWQDASGAIHQTIPGGSRVFLSQNLSEYLRG